MRRAFEARLVNWLASHLVAMSLLGFLLVGMCVFGVAACPDFSVWRDPEPGRVGKPEPAPVLPGRPAGEPAPSGAPADARTADRPAPGLAPAAESPVRAGPEGRTEPSGVPAPPANRGPRYIGGAIPVYGDGPGAAGEGFRPAPRAPDTAEPGTSAPGPAGRAAVPGRDDYLQRARRAFWDGNYLTAEAVYVEMIGRFPGDADAFGELGNLYHTLGRHREAREALYEAGLRLKLAGETDRLRDVVEFLETTGDPRVEHLRP